MYTDRKGGAAIADTLYSNEEVFGKVLHKKNQTDRDICSYYYKNKVD